MTTHTGISHETPAIFFRREVEGALRSLQVEATEDSAAYLVHLLELFVEPEGLYESACAGPDRPLVELLDAAGQVDGAARFALLKLTGDIALFVSGFLAESFARRPLGPRYYRALGASAYDGAAASCPRASRAQVFAELASRFQHFVDVLEAVAERCAVTAPCTEADLLKIYQRWLATGSPRAAELLRRHGVALAGDFGAPS
ncbi:MAG: hypothetical protein AAGC60_10925 [Acidobacteriota bacterium]